MRLLLIMMFALVCATGARAAQEQQGQPVFVPAEPVSLLNVNEAPSGGAPAVGPASSANGAYPGSAGRRAADAAFAAEHGLPPPDFEANPDAPAGAPLAPSTTGDTNTCTANPVMLLSASGPDAIGAREARTILEGMGMLRGSAKLSTGLRALHYTHTYTFTRKRPATDDVKLTDEERRWLFDDATQLKLALARYPGQPDINDANASYDRWVDQASAQLKHVPAAQRRPLLESLLKQETTRIHWRSFVIVQSVVGATGFSQLLAKTAEGVHVNRFDPGDNLVGSARFLDDCIAQHGLTGGLAYYNGGEHPPAASYAYARAIELRAKIPVEAANRNRATRKK